MFYDVHKENMFTINLGDGREAPSKARKKGAKRFEFLVLQNSEFTIEIEILVFLQIKFKNSL